MDLRIPMCLVLFLSSFFVVILSVHANLYRFWNTNIPNETLDEVNVVKHSNDWRESTYSFSMNTLRRLIGIENRDQSYIMNIKGTNNETWGPCMCGAFLRQFLKRNKPLFSRSYIAVECNTRGEHICYESCIGLSHIGWKRIEEYACKILENASNLHLSLSTRICAEGDWLYTGLTTTKSLCCSNGRKILCGNVNKSF